MKSTKFVRKNSLVLSILLLLMFCGVNSVAANTEVIADKWQSEITIYGWFPSLDGDLKYDLGGGGSVTVDTSQILDSLNFVFMGTYEGRYNKWSFGADILYMDVSGSENTTVNVSPGPGPGVPVSVSAGLGLKTLVLTGVGGYDVVQTNKARLALIGGVRYLELDADVNLTVTGLSPTPIPANLSESVGILDGIIGIKGAFMLNEHWYVPYYADIGTGDSKMTLQLFAGLGYMFHWGDIRLGYRYMEYDQDDDKFLQDLAFSGILLGVGFRF
jgi:hypothetical protein